MPTSIEVEKSKAYFWSFLLLTLFSHFSQVHPKKAQKVAGRLIPSPKSTTAAQYQSSVEQLLGQLRDKFSKPLSTFTSPEKDALFISAALWDHADTIKLLLDMRVGSSTKIQVFLTAAEHGSLDSVKVLLQSEVYPNVQNGEALFSGLEMDTWTWSNISRKTGPTSVVRTAWL